MERSEMDTNLMCPPCKKLRSDQLEISIIAALYFYKCRPSDSSILHYRHFQPIFRVSAYRFVYDETLFERRLDDSEIVASHTFILQLLGELPMSHIVFRHHQKAAGLFIYSVHDALTLLSSECREGDTLFFEPIHQCGLFDAWSRMHNHSRRFVDNENILIFINLFDVKIDLLGLTFLHIWNRHDNFLTSFEYRSWFRHHFSIDFYIPLFYRLLYLTSRTLQMTGQKFVQSLLLNPTQFDLFQTSNLFRYNCMKKSAMFWIDRRIITHFDLLLPLLLFPFMFLSHYLIAQIDPMLAKKQLLYFFVGFVAFFAAFIAPIREYKWFIPSIYWIMIVLLFAVDLFGVSKLGAKRWLELPFFHMTIQPSEIFKPAFILMLAYLIQNDPPPKEGYGWREFLRISFFILLPFLLIAKEPDLGTAMILLIIGYGVLFIVGVNWKIWITLALILALFAPLAYNYLLHDYQKKRIEDFLSEKPSYHVQQSIIAIGSGGLEGKPQKEATQTKLRFLPIATSDFIFAYYVERFGFFGALGLVLLYALLILHLFGIFIKLKGDHFTQVVAISISLLIFTYMSVNIAMTMGLAPVVGVPLPLFSYGGSSFVNFMVLFGILEHLLAFRFRFLYNSKRF